MGTSAHRSIAKRVIQLPWQHRSYAKLNHFERRKVWNTILSYVLFPEDGMRRRGAEASFDAHLRYHVGHAANHLERKGKPRRRELKLAKLLDATYGKQPWEFLLRHSFNRASLRSMRKIEMQIHSTFSIVCLLARLEAYHDEHAGGASLNKAMEIIDRVASETQRRHDGAGATRSGQQQNSSPKLSDADRPSLVDPPAMGADQIAKKGIYAFLPKRSVLQSTWSTYRGVAHLHAALVICVARARKLGCPVFDELDTFLGAALYFQTFLLRFRVKQSGKPLIDSSEMWQIPHLCGVSEVDMALPELTAREAKALADYRAPKRY